MRIAVRGSAVFALILVLNASVGAEEFNLQDCNAAAVEADSPVLGLFHRTQSLAIALSQAQREIAARQKELEAKQKEIDMLREGPP